jgi:predicted AAA+ superfamily ATPase
VSIIAVVRHYLIKQRIERADTRLECQAAELNSLRRAYDPRTSAQIASDVSKRAKAL